MGFLHTTLKWHFINKCHYYFYDEVDLHMHELWT